MSKEPYKIKATEPFAIGYKLFFDKTELEKFEKFKNRLKINPYQGDQLRVSYVREFKTQKGKRAYFLIYDEILIVLFIALSDKKSQKNVINEIFKELEEFKKYTYRLYKS